MSYSGRHLPERVVLLYKFDRADVLPLILIPVIAAFALWGFIYPPLLISLLTWFVLLRVARALMSAIYRRAAPPPEKAARWEDYYCLLAVVFGAVWGIVSVYFYSSRDQFQELTVTFLISLIALGLPVSLAPSPKTFVGFMVPLVTPLIGMLFARSGAVSISVAMMMLLYSALVLWLYLSANRTLLDKLTLDAVNVALTRQVGQARERLSLAVRASQLAIWEWTEKGVVIYVDEVWAEMRGAPPGVTYVTLDEALALVHPDERQSIIDATQPQGRGCRVPRRGAGGQGQRRMDVGAVPRPGGGARCERPRRAHDRQQHRHQPAQAGRGRVDERAAARKGIVRHEVQVRVDGFA